MIRTRTWILLLGGLLLAGLLFLLRPPAEARFAEIWSDGELVCRVSLAEDQSILVESRYGTNTVTVSQGKICRDAGGLSQWRMHASRLAKWGRPIICLPHRLVVQFSQSGEMDAISG